MIVFLPLESSFSATIFTEINNKVYFIPHLHSRDGHQNLNLRYFKENSYSLKDFEMPISKKISKEYLNSLINPFSMQKILCYLTR